MCDAYINPTPPSAPRRMACEMRVEPTVSHYTMKKGLKAVKITPRIIPGRSSQISGSRFKSMSTLCDAWTNWSTAKISKTHPPITPISFTDVGFRNVDSPSASPKTRGASTIVWPTAHCSPERTPTRVALRVEAKNSGPGLRTPETLTSTTGKEAGRDHGRRRRSSNLITRIFG